MNVEAQALGTSAQGAAWVPTSYIKPHEFNLNSAPNFSCLLKRVPWETAGIGSRNYVPAAQEGYPG